MTTSDGIALDSNILVYGEGFGDPDRTATAKRLLKRLREETLVVPAQALAELYRVLVKKARLPAPDARMRVLDYETSATIAPTLAATLGSALTLAAEHHLQIFDAIILAASAEAGCRLLLSEDMQDGFVWHGITVANPFAPVPHPLLADALRR